MFHSESFYGGVTKLEAHESTRYFCYQCDYEVTSKQSLKAHEEAVHQGVEY